MKSICYLLVSVLFAALGQIAFCQEGSQSQGQPETFRLWVLKGDGEVIVHPTPKEIIIDLPGLPEDATPLAVVHIPAGSFMMGSDDPVWSSSFEQPVHEVNIEYDFYMGKVEVTQAQWLAVMGGWPEQAPNSEKGLGDNYPSYFISWHDCQDFVTALSQLGQGTFRLPSEAEWEYACRAGTTTEFFFGDSYDCNINCEDCAAGTLPGNRTDYMWYCGNNGTLGSPAYGSKPVGGKLPNAWGLVDMSGNLWEWCQDSYQSGYDRDSDGVVDAPTDGSAWEIPTRLQRAVRGGAWANVARDCRSAIRSGAFPDTRGVAVGFRVVWTP